MVVEGLNKNNETYTCVLGGVMTSNNVFIEIHRGSQLFVIMLYDISSMF